MPGINTLFGLLFLAWFIPAFFFTYYHFKQNPVNKGFKKKVSLILFQLSFIFWPIILVISGLIKLISKLAGKKVKDK